MALGYATPAALAAALLQDSSVHAPAYTDESGRRHAPRVEGLLWILGRDECIAIRCVEPGSTGVRVNPMTGEIELFGLPVYECRRDSACLIVKAVEMEGR